MQGQIEMAKKIAAYGQFPQQVTRIFEIFEREGAEVYLVGGTVREILRGQTENLNDFDFATPT